MAKRDATRYLSYYSSATWTSRLGAICSLGNPWSYERAAENLILYASLCTGSSPIVTGMTANQITITPGSTSVTVPTGSTSGNSRTMQSINLTAQASNLEVDYKHVGCGLAGSSGINIIPQVTVKLTGLTYNFVALGAFGLSGVTMPNFQSTLIAEDLSSCSPDNTQCP